MNIFVISDQLFLIIMKRLLPRKAEYRARPHANPLNRTNFPFPPHHSYVDWRSHFPIPFGGTSAQNQTPYCNTQEHLSSYDQPRQYPLNNNAVSILDVGCGYGGLLFALAPLFPNQLICGLQIRDTVVNYVNEKIVAYRSVQPGKFDNIGVVRTNAMRHLCQYFPKQTLQKIFVCFPDPHFKTSKFKRRVISTGTLSQFSYLLKPKGRVYCVTDVAELHQWHLQHLTSHEMFNEVVAPQDPCIDLMTSQTEQSQKVRRSGGNIYWTIFERRDILD